MTLRVTVEIVPFGLEGAKRTLGVMELHNTSLLDKSSNYQIEAQNETGASDSFELKGHDRDRGWLPLVQRAFELLASRKPKFSVKL